MRGATKGSFYKRTTPQRDYRRVRIRAEELTDPVVHAVVTAMRDGDRKAFFAALSPSAMLTDNNVNPQPLVEWAD